MLTLPPPIPRAVKPAPLIPDVPLTAYAKLISGTHESPVLKSEWLSHGLRRQGQYVIHQLTMKDGSILGIMLSGEAALELRDKLTRMIANLDV